MTAPHGDEIVAGYLARLDQALAGAPPGTAQELRADVTAHIAEARAELREETDAAVLNILDRLGDPALMVAEGHPSTTAGEIPIPRATISAATPAGASGCGQGLAYAALMVMAVTPFTADLAPLALLAALLLASLSSVWRRRELANSVGVSLAAVAFVEVVLHTGFLGHDAFILAVLTFPFRGWWCAVYLAVVAQGRGWRPPDVQALAG